MNKHVWLCNTSCYTDLVYGDYAKFYHRAEQHPCHGNTDGDTIVLCELTELTILEPKELEQTTGKWSDDEQLFTPGFISNGSNVLYANYKNCEEKYGSDNIRVYSLRIIEHGDKNT